MNSGAQGGVPVLAHQVAVRGSSEQSCLPTLARPPRRPRIDYRSPQTHPAASPAQYTACRPQHQPLNGLRAAPARAHVAAQRTRHPSPQNSLPAAISEGSGARPTAAPSHRGPFRRIHAPSDPPLTVARSLASISPPPSLFSRTPVQTTRHHTAAAAVRHGRCRRSTLPTAVAQLYSFLFRRAAYGGPPARCVGRPKRAKRGGQRLAPACGRRGGGGRGVVRGAV
mmetsp:Transcript_15271/g.49146  ORF Transcript_15271/g.49146 Transcript_15271/m.49146 type:complete len:225 (-) Transcript_15271:136-810(-)